MADDTPYVRAEEVSSLVVGDDLVESVYDPADAHPLGFRVWRNGEFEDRTRDHVTRVDGVIDFSGEKKNARNETIIPPHSMLDPIAKNQILLPSKPVEYGDDADLVKEIEDHLRRYNDVPEFQIKFGARYILMTWVFDLFFSICYLQALGESGTGKSRYLGTLAPLCYKAIRSTGSMSVSPMFRLIEAIGGTFCVDEAAALSDTGMRSAFASVLNAGYSKDGCVMRSEVNEGGGYTPKFYSVFRPKIFGSRIRFADDATESRCFTFQHFKKKVRADISRDLPLSIDGEMLAIRNKLLLWRWRNYSRIANELPENRKALVHLDPPRLAEISLPIYSVSDLAFRKELLLYLKKQSTDRQSTGPQTVVVAALMSVCRDVKSKVVFPGDIAAKIEQDAAHLDADPEEFKARRVGDIPAELGFPALKRTNHGIPRLIDKGKLNEVAKQMGMELDQTGTRVRLSF